MNVITIREQGQTETGFNATLVIDRNNYNITVSIFSTCLASMRRIRSPITQLPRELLHQN